MTFRLSNIYLTCFAFLLAIYIHLRDVVPGGMSELLYLIFLLIPSYKILYKNETVVYVYIVFFMLILVLLTTILNGFSDGAYYEIVLSFYTLTLLLLVGYKYARHEDQYFVYKVLTLFVIFSGILAVIYIAAFLLFYAGFHNDSVTQFLYVRNGFARLQGLLANPNYFSLSMLLVVYIGLLIKRKILAVKISILFVLLAVVFSMSRGAILALSVLLFFHFLYLFMSNRKLVFMYVSGFVILSLVGISVVANDSYFGHFNEAVDRRLNDTGGGVSSRLEAVSTTVEAASDTVMSMLFGVGLDKAKAFSADGLAPHNTFVRILGELGAFSLITYLFLFLLIASNFPKHIERIPYLGTLMSLLLACATNDYFLVREFWLLLAVLIVITSRNSSHRTHFI